MKVFGNRHQTFQGCLRLQIGRGDGNATRLSDLAAERDITLSIYVMVTATIPYICRSDCHKSADTRVKHSLFRLACIVGIGNVAVSALFRTTVL